MFYTSIDTCDICKKISVENTIRVCRCNKEVHQDCLRKWRYSIVQRNLKCTKCESRYNFINYTHPTLSIFDYIFIVSIWLSIFFIINISIYILALISESHMDILISHKLSHIQNTFFFIWCIVHVCLVIYMYMYFMYKIPPIDGNDCNCCNMGCVFICIPEDDLGDDLVGVIGMVCIIIFLILIPISLYITIWHQLTVYKLWKKDTNLVNPYLDIVV
jgi:hypothetical protein